MKNPQFPCRRAAFGCVVRVPLAPLLAAAMLALSGVPGLVRAERVSHIVFMIGENEYDTRQTLPEFARTELEPRGIRCSFAMAPSDDSNEFPGLEALSQADLLFISVRRRTPSKPDMALIRAHLASGKPVVGIRTASHAFGAAPKDESHEGWVEFDREVLGADYEGHYGSKPPNDAGPRVKLVAESNHPVLTGLTRGEFRVTSHLYKNRNPGAGVTILMTGVVEEAKEIEPVTWVNTANNRRVFYTSLGNPEDFKIPAVRRLILNGTFWALDKPVP